MPNAIPIFVYVMLLMSVLILCAGLVAHLMRRPLELGAQLLMYSFGLLLLALLCAGCGDGCIEDMRSKSLKHPVGANNVDK